MVVPVALPSGGSHLDLGPHSSFSCNTYSFAATSAPAGLHIQHPPAQQPNAAHILCDFSIFIPLSDAELPGWRKSATVVCLWIGCLIKNVA